MEPMISQILLKISFSFSNIIVEIYSWQNIKEILVQLIYGKGILMKVFLAQLGFGKP